MKYELKRPCFGGDAVTGDYAFHITGKQIKKYKSENQNLKHKELKKIGENLENKLTPVVR